MSESLVPNGPLREAYLRARAAGRDENDIVLDLGWVDVSGRPEATRLRRALGLSPKGGCDRPCQHVTYPVAAAVCKAIGAYPVDVGI